MTCQGKRLSVKRVDGWTISKRIVGFSDERLTELKVEDNPLNDATSG